jgi:hypothetical protein
MLIVAGLCVAWIFIRRPAWERHLTGGRPTRGRKARLAAIALMLIAQLAGILVLIDAGRARVRSAVNRPLRARYERQWARMMPALRRAVRETSICGWRPCLRSRTKGAATNTYFRSLFDIIRSGYIAEIVQMPPAAALVETRWGTGDLLGTRGSPRRYSATDHGQDHELGDDCDAQNHLSLAVGLRRGPAWRGCQAGRRARRGDDWGRSGDDSSRQVRGRHDRAWRQGDNGDWERRGRRGRDPLDRRWNRCRRGRGGKVGYGRHFTSRSYRLGGRPAAGIKHDAGR